MRNAQASEPVEATRARSEFILRLFIEIEKATGVEHTEDHVENIIDMLQIDGVGQIHMEIARKYILRYACRYCSPNRLIRYPDFYPTDDDTKKAEMNIANHLRREFHRGLNQGRSEGKVLGIEECRNMMLPEYQE